MRYYFALLTSFAFGCIPPHQDSWRHYEGGGTYPDSPFVSDAKEFVLFSSPDSGHGDLFRYDFGKATTTKITSHTSFEANAIISPDGQFIFDEREHDGIQHIHCMRVDGTDERQVTKGEVIDTLIEVSGNGDNLIVIRSPLSEGAGRQVTAYLVGTLKSSTKPVKCGQWATFAVDFRSVFYTPHDDTTHTYFSGLALGDRKKIAAGTWCRASHKKERIAVVRDRQAW